MHINVYSLFAGLVAILLTACISPQAAENARQGHMGHPVGIHNTDSVLHAVSEKKLYKVMLESADHPVPLGQIHHWIVTVYKADGTALDNGRLFVNGGMPAHRHGFPTKPRITDYLGKGAYKVDGIKFSMRGQWEMRFVIKDQQGRQRDRVVFKINL